MMLRARKKTCREVSLYEPIGTDKEGNEVRLLDIIESNQEDASVACERRENIKRLHDLLSSALSPQEYEVLKFRYGLFGEKELTQKLIAQQLGISRSYV